MAEAIVTAASAMGAMSDQSKSDLIDLLDHEHHHLRSLFSDLRTTFDEVLSGNPTLDEQAEMLENAQGDIETAFDDMMRHFNLEEEVFFVAIRARFPERADAVSALVATHELFHARFKWLQTVLGRGVEGLRAELSEVHEVLASLDAAVTQHTATENEIFGDALRQMSPAERDALLAEARKL